MTAWLSFSFDKINKVENQVAMLIGADWSEKGTFYRARVPTLFPSYFVASQQMEEANDKRIEKKHLRGMLFD